MWSTEPIAWNKIPQLAKLLRTRRERLGLTPERVAEALKLPVGAYLRLEKAGLMPEEPTLRRACMLLSLDYASVMARMGNKEGGATRS
ncbi:MAG TPA: helix-turn-helix transcriptional regulator [Archangium sp.]|nr:helix-turn-helix transcriptional regulator [Archangium sp.]